MDAGLFERLLHEEEGDALDFKRDQYRFSKASDEEKSELLKDILGFANALRRSAAYILIGVDEVRGGRSKVVGIPQNAQLTDHTLQQFVNNLTNRPVRFRYEAFAFEGKEVGIIQIADEQPRPVYLKRDYGKLSKNEVYVRRGSCIDPSKPANPEEIAAMGRQSRPDDAQLAVEFAHIGRDDSLGTTFSWEAEYCRTPCEEEIPELLPPRSQNAFVDVLHGMAGDPLLQWTTNRRFYRQLAEFEFARRLFRPVRLVIKNIGQVAAENVRCELEIAANTDVFAEMRSNMPEAPRRRSLDLAAPVLSQGKSAHYREPGDVTIDQNEDRFRIEVDCENLQPGRRVWSEVFYIGKAESGECCLVGRVYAANLPEPKDFQLLIRASIADAIITVDDLMALPEPSAFEDYFF